MAAPATTFTAALGALETVRRTHAAHLDALGALERAFDAEMVRNRRLIIIEADDGAAPTRLSRRARHL
jgi:hypothetical protein